MYVVVTMSTPRTMARGSVRPGSRTSPAILLTSHQPPKEKNAPTIAAPSAGPNGSEPGCCAMNGTKLDHDPSRITNAHKTSDPSTPSLSQVVQRRNPALTRMLKIFRTQSAQITAIAMNLMTSVEDGKM